MHLQEDLIHHRQADRTVQGPGADEDGGVRKDGRLDHPLRAPGK